MSRHILLLALMLVIAICGSAQDVVLNGLVKSNSGEACPYTVVGATRKGTNETQGVACDENGHFTLKLKSGTYDLVFHLIGYEDLKVHISIQSNLTRTFTLTEKSTETSDIIVYADRKDIAREAIKNAIDHRIEHLGRGNGYTYDSYIKNSVQEIRRDTSKVGKDSTYLALKEDERPLINYQAYLIESIGKVRFEPPTSYNEDVIAFNDYITKKPRDNHFVGIHVDYGEQEITPTERPTHGNYIIQSNIGYNEFNLYNRLLHLPSLTEKKILSPIGESALLSYSFQLENIYYIDTTRVFIIQVKPVFPGEALFTGTVHIRSDDWALIEADLDINPTALYFCENFHLHHQYQKGPSGQYVSWNDKYDYIIKNGEETLKSQITAVRQNFSSDSTDKRISMETLSYRDDAFDKDSLFWKSFRTESLTALESNFAHHCDSLQRYYKSDEFYEKEDSSYNQTRIQDFLFFGIGYRNRAKNYDFFIDPLLMQINPVGIGGYRHKLSGTFQKEFPNAYLLETTGSVDYGFRNEDVKGKVGVGLTYIPKKFVRTFIRVGDFYDMINTYASLGSVFSRSNYVRTQTASIAQRMEVFNGFFAELTFEYSDQKPISNLSPDKWSQRVFGEINTPINFERYTKSEIRLDVEYKIAQKYIIKKNKKIILGSAYPKINFIYRKGIPGLFNSEVDFDYLELGARHEKELGRLGNMEWSVLAGSFINKRNLRILEYRYFRGSDVFFFSDPIKSFQLLGPTLSTPNAYLRGNYFHHFNGIILNKIPLVNKLKLTEAIGAAFLSIPSQNFHHAEFYAGLERAFRIRSDLYRLGVYACSADSSWSKARIEFKLGLNFFDSFHKKWMY